MWSLICTIYLTVPVQVGSQQDSVAARCPEFLFWYQNWNFHPKKTYRSTCVSIFLGNLSDHTCSGWLSAGSSICQVSRNFILIQNWNFQPQKTYRSKCVIIYFYNIPVQVGSQQDPASVRCSEIWFRFQNWYSHLKKTYKSTCMITYLYNLLDCTYSGWLPAGSSGCQVSRNFILIPKLKFSP